MSDLKQQWIKNAKSRRERITALGGRELTILLEKPAADALRVLCIDAQGYPVPIVQVITGLLLKALKQRSRADRAK